MWYDSEAFRGVIAAWLLCMRIPGEVARDSGMISPTIPI